MMRVPTCLLLLLVTGTCFGADAPQPKVDERFPYRTNFSNEHLPWYQLQRGVFPPSHAENRVSGELLEFNQLQRSGKFRRVPTGEVVEFRMLPFGIANYLGSETELRHLPLGTRFLFYTYPDESGEFTLVGSLLDDYTAATSHSWTYRVDGVNPETKELTITQQSIPKKTVSDRSSVLKVAGDTKLWKGQGEPATFEEIQPGMAILFNTQPPKSGGRGPAAEIWLDAESQEFATTRQKKIRADYLKERGIAGWIDSTTDTQFTVTLFNRENQDLLKTGFAEGAEVKVAVAEETLQTDRPWIDGMNCRLVERRKVPANMYAHSGVQLVLEPRLMLEGFRKGGVVRIYGEGWVGPSLPEAERLFP
ncbi:hypothetical protein [Planctomicrobium sp. SH664]|uniref:hypothetical protein n=1 Tax=Planctomicrobium sp. SH664 TaxID=3448125 RepID=UPI003F5C25E5